MKFSDILEHKSLDEIEGLLREELKKVDFIGQIELDETSYSRLMQLMRNNYTLNDIKWRSIPPALFLTSMVFCARYSNEQSRNFWEPYAHSWMQHSDTNFQRWCRGHFIQSSHKLSWDFGFDFPKVTAGDVVRPVYYHALIPAYLKDDFAAWLNQMLPDFMRMDPEQIANDLEDRTYYIAPTLKTFLLSDDTQPAAVALIVEMLDAVRLYQDGEKPEEIWNYLSSIIEREIWEQLLPNIQRGLPRKRISQPKIEWIWDLESGQMLLRVHNIISPPEYKPYQLVLSSPNQLTHDSDWRERIYAYKKTDGTWYLDEHIIESIESDLAGYQVSIVDINNKIILGSRLVVPSLPKADIVFCRITQQGIYAIPMPISTSYADAEWIVLLKKNTSIFADLASFYKPNLLELEYASALRGFIKFPVTVEHENGKQEQLEPKYSYTIQVELQGEQLESLSQKVPPVFSSHNIYLILSAPPEQLARLKLQLEHDGRLIKQFRLSQIELLLQDGHFIIDLSLYLQGSVGKFTLNLVRGISSVLNSPIQFSILPHISILGFPDPQEVYHVDHLPSVILKNLSHSARIEYGENVAVISEQQNGTRQIKWTDLQKSQCSLVIDGVPLAWEIQRVWAWIEHNGQGEIKGIKELGKARLHIRGLRYQDIKICVNDISYSLKLDSKGQFDTLIEYDRLYDLLKTEAGGNIRLEIHSRYGKWILWESINKVNIEYAEINYEPFGQLLTANIKLSYSLGGRFEYQVLLEEEQCFVGYYNTLQLIDTLDIQIPVFLRAGQYRLILLYRGISLQDIAGATVFTVTSIVDSFLQRKEPPNQEEKLRLLSLKYQEFEKIDDELPQYWNLLQYISRAGNMAELLPAWAVTENALSCSISVAGAVRQIILYPEKARHKGQMGVGKTPISLSNDEKRYAYAEWESLGGHQFTIRFGLPVGSPSSFWDLDPYDLYPVYYSKRDSQLYAKDGGYPTTQEIHEQDLIEVSNVNSLPCEIYPNQKVLQYSLKAHYVVDRRYFIAKLEYNDKYVITKPQANDYRLAIDNFLNIESVRTNRKRILSFLAPDSKYRTMLEAFEDELKSHTLIGNTTLSHVTLRFIQSALLWSDNKDHNYYHIEHLVMLLSLALRLRAYYPHLSREIDALIPENDLIELVTLVEDLAPELFIWSLTWVELFANHAIS